MPPFTELCTFDAGGDLTLALETNPHLSGRVIAVLRNGHKRWMHAVRILECEPESALPAGRCGPLSSLPEQVPDRTLLEGLNRLLGDCARLLPPGSVHADGLHEQPDLSQLTVRIEPSELRCRVIMIYHVDGREAARTFVNLPESWTGNGPYASPLSSADALIQEAAERLQCRHQARVALRGGPADPSQHLRPVGKLVASPGDGRLRHLRRPGHRRDPAVPQRLGLGGQIQAGRRLRRVHRPVGGLGACAHRSRSAGLGRGGAGRIGGTGRLTTKRGRAG